MTWISLQNFAPAIFTGFYGGMGYNPWATFDWNISGTGMLLTPFSARYRPLGLYPILLSNNLSYITNGLYILFIFMYVIKRRYVAWWEKYNYLLESSFHVGFALSAIIQFFALFWNKCAVVG